LIRSFYSGGVIVSVVLAVLLVAGCASTHHPAPVSDRTRAPSPATAPSHAQGKPAAGIAREPDTRPELYTVKRGDTLYMIALDNGLDYKELAEWNGIDNPNVIRSGQQLRLRAPAGAVVTTPLKAESTVQGRPVTNAPAVTAGAPAAGANDAVKSQPKGVKLPYSDQALAQLSAPVVAAPAVPAVKPPVVAVTPKVEPRAEEKPAAGDEDE
jgi:lipoprotein NlpD